MPHHRKLRLCLSQITTTLVIAILTASFAYASQTDELEQVKKELRQVNKKLDGSRTKRSKTQLSLQQVEKDIVERTLRQEQTQTKLAELELKSTALSLKKDTLNTKYIESLEEVKKLLIATYKLGQQSGLKSLLSLQDPMQISRFSQYSNYIAKSRKVLIDETKRLASNAANAETQLVARNKQLAKLSLILEKDQAYLSQLQNNRLNSIEKLEREITAHSNKAEDLKNREIRLGALLNNIAVQSANRRKQAKAHSKVYSKRQEGTDKNTVANTIDQTNIAASGSLPLPVKAKLVARFGQKRAETGIPWSGILLRGKPGSEVRTVAAGEVVYADWLSGYGQLIIIDHGSELMSLYGHNRSLNRAVGDQVQQNDLIAYMGDTAGLRSAALYFEIRHRGEPKDPLKWCKA